MMNKMRAGWNWWVRGCGGIGIALVVALTGASTARAVTPVGDGTEGNPYQISQLGHLVWMGDTVGSSSGQYYTVQNDIDASATTNWNDGAGFAPIATNSGMAFMGVFNGNGKVIRGLTIYRPSQNGVALFGFVGMGSGGVVKNIGLTECSVSGSMYVGGLVGHSYGTVSGCYASGAVTGANNYVAGLVGVNYGTVSGCYATCSAAGGGSGWVGGLVGYNTGGGTVIGSYATGPVSGGPYIGGLVGANSSSTVRECYAAGQVTGSTSVGGLVGWNNSTVTNSYWDTNTSGQAASAGGTGTNTAAMMRQATFVGWDFTNVWKITENETYPVFAVAAVVPTGAGTTGAPYQISQLGHLVWMGATVGSSSGKVYTVQNDIDASATAVWENGAGFAPIGTAATNFLGVFNGNGKVISGLTIHRPSQENVGLFGFVGGSGVVRNLGLSRGSVTGGDYVGGLAGRNSGLLSECYATGATTGNWYVGGLVGENYNTLSGCYATGPITGNDFVGGLVGENFYYTTMNQCYAVGTVSGIYVGGLIGSSFGQVSSCYATGTVTGTYAGGLVGYNAGPVNDCYATGPASGSYYAAGLVANNYGSVSNCYAMGRVTGTGLPSGVGGLVGNNVYGTVGDSYWDVETSGQASSFGGAGTNTAAMMQQATFVGWNFTNVWSIEENAAYPRLRVPWDLGYRDIGGGWRRLTWFGDYVPMGGEGWIWHNKHGFFFVPTSSTPQNVWLYAQDMGWLYTSNTLYPFLFRASDNAWLWYNGATNPRWFRNMTANTWESRP